jgi:hypothetical protein
MPIIKPEVVNVHSVEVFNNSVSETGSVAMIRCKMKEQDLIRNVVFEKTEDNSYCI